MSSPWILIPGENEQMHAVLMTSIFSISHQSLINKKIATKLTPQKGNNNKKATTKQPKKKTKTFFSRNRLVPVNLYNYKVWNKSCSKLLHPD